MRARMRIGGLALATMTPLAAASLLSLSTAIVAQQRVLEAYERPLQVEAEPSLPPTKDPLSAWAIAERYVPQGNWIRRIAFAEHGFFVFHGPAQSAEIWGTFVGWSDDGYDLQRVDPASPRDSSICTAPGVEPALVEPALRALLVSDAYVEHASRLHGLILECYEDKLYWTLLPIPPEGFQSGQSLSTIDLPFETFNP